MVSGGSSPRGRGTQHPQLGIQFVQRIIPARAGNAELNKLLTEHKTDHPRAGGERPFGRQLQWD